MYSGYPVGYLLFWQNALSDDSRTIGTESKQLPARLLIVDGQQRLTSLYSVIRGIPVIREDYRQEIIEIAFNPLQERFEVIDAAIRRDRTFLPNISVLWRRDTDFFEVVDSYFKNLDPKSEIPEEDRRHIRKAIHKLSNLLTFPFTALELSARVDEAQVAEVFVRINSKGTPLNQADFILTLMSVFWDEGRAQLEDFCRASKQLAHNEESPFNHFIQPSPDQILRVGVGVGFKRARLKYVYSLLRGKDLETEDFSDELREQQFDLLKNAQIRVINLRHWHDFFRAIQKSGYRSGRMITSDNNILFTYVLYLLGRTEYAVAESELQRVIARWFFMVSLTGRYTKSPESDFEFDLARYRGINSAEEFVNILDSVCDATLTSDYWSITLPNELATSAPRSPSLFAYYAALVLLDAKALFSKDRVVDLLEPSTHSQRSVVERHHLFPRAYLEKLGVRDKREINQIANYALAEWKEDSDLINQAPADYLAKLRRRVDPTELPNMYFWHALPDGWEELPYHEFLIRRREHMASVIAAAFQKLGPKSQAPAAKRPIATIVEQGESTHIEFKSTLRVNLHTGEKDPRMELACIKTIAGFLNTQGGTLVIGVADDGNPVGLDADGFANEDKMNLFLVNLLSSRIGAKHAIYIHPKFDDYRGYRVMTVECYPSRSPVFVKDGSTERFFVRSGAATMELSPSETQGFIRSRFKA